MMREVLARRFKRLIDEAPRPLPPADTGPVASANDASAPGAEDAEAEAPQADEERRSHWPDLVLIDGGRGQLSAARETLAALGVGDLPLVAIAKGPDRDAGRETFFVPGREPFKLEPRDPVLYFVQRLRDEAHRFAIGSHRARRRRDIREAGLQEIPGIGPTRKRALLHHFGTLKAIERAALCRSIQGSRHQRRDRAQDLRLLPRRRGLSPVDRRYSSRTYGFAMTTYLPGEPPFGLCRRHGLSAPSGDIWGWRRHPL